MNFLFAWRYFKAKKSTNAINVIAWVSVVAITLITAAFIVLLSVFNGFEGLVKSLYSSFYTDLRIIPKEGKRLALTAEQLRRISRVPGLKAYSLVIEEKTLLQNGDIQTIVFLKGVDDNYPLVSGVANSMIRGTFDPGTADEPAIILGSGIENALALHADRSIYPVTAYLFKPGVNTNVIDPLQAFAAENMNPVGTFFIQQDIDNKYAITNVGFMQRMLGLKPDQYSSVELSLVRASDASSVREDLESILPGNYVVQTRYQQNAGLYNVMTLEKWAIYGILTLMLIVASFTMVGSLTMLVLEKQKDIQVLKAMGAPNRLVQRIFLSEGLLLAGIGIIAGILLALLICWAQVKYKLIAIEGGTFLIDYYPVKLVPMDFMLVVVTVVLIAFTAAWFPSRKAGLQPVHLRS